MDAAVLRRAWAGLRAGEAGLVDIEPVLAMYGDADRHYHNARHVAQCLREVDELRPACDDPQAVRAALLFHDCVYDPRRGDNEARSAEIAAEYLGRVGWSGPALDVVRTLILATRHAEPPPTPDAAVVVDADLSVLGKSADQFDAYDRDIRREYAHVPDAAFRAGRAHVLQRFVDRPRIYTTDEFADRYERKARENLARCIRALEAR